MGEVKKTSQYLVAGRWLSWFETVVPEVLLQIFCILLPICWRVAFWLWVLRRKIYGSSLDHKMYIPSFFILSKMSLTDPFAKNSAKSAESTSLHFFWPCARMFGRWYAAFSGALKTFSFRTACYLPHQHAGLPHWLSYYANIGNSKCSPCWRIFRPIYKLIGFFHFLGRNSKTGRRWSASFGCGWRFAKCLDANGQMVYKFKRQVTMISEVGSSG